MLRSLKIIALLCFIIFFVAGQASAINFNFSGKYRFLDVDSDGFAETLDFASFFGPGSGTVFNSNPVDLLFSDPGYEYIQMSNLTLDSTSFVPGVRYDFSPNLITNGFKLFDDNNDLLFTADFTVTSLIDIGSVGSINPGFSMNLTNITQGVSYTLGDSAIIDAFLNAPGGATNISFQLAGSLASLIQGGVGVGNYSTYSGSAAPVAEPATMLLLGSGLIGLAGLGRRKFLKNIRG